MTKNFDTLYENILHDLETSATLTPVGPITVATAPAEDECQGDCEEQETIEDEITETEIATQIINHIKKLRRQIGEDTYYRAGKIQDLAEKLLEMHPDIEIKDTVKESTEFDDLYKYAENVYKAYDNIKSQKGDVEADNYLDSAINKFKKFIGTHHNFKSLNNELISKLSRLIEYYEGNVPKVLQIQKKYYIK